MDPDTPRYGLPLPGIDLHDSDAMQTMRSVPISNLRKKRKQTERLDYNRSKRRKTSHDDDNALSTDSSYISEASNDSTIAFALRRALSSNSSGTSTPMGHKVTRVDDCVMCRASALQLAGLDMVRVPTYVTEWIHAHLAEHKWDSIWKDLEALSTYLCAMAKKNNIDLYFMKAEDWQDHYLNETRDQYVWVAAQQVDYRIIHQKLKDSLLYKPEQGPPENLAFAHQNSKHTLEFLKANLRLNDKAAEMAKATLSGGNNSQVDNARRMTIVNYIFTNAGNNQQ